MRKLELFDVRFQTDIPRTTCVPSPIAYELLLFGIEPEWKTLELSPMKVYTGKDASGKSLEFRTTENFGDCGSICLHIDGIRGRLHSKGEVYIDGKPHKIGKFAYA